MEDTEQQLTPTDYIDSRLNNSQHGTITIRTETYDDLALTRQLRDYQGDKVKEVAVIFEAVADARARSSLVPVMLENVAHFLRNHHFPNDCHLRRNLSICNGTREEVDELVEALCDNRHLLHRNIGTSISPSPRLIQRLLYICTSNSPGLNGKLAVGYHDFDFDNDDERATLLCFSCWRGGAYDNEFSFYARNFEDAESLLGSFLSSGVHHLYFKIHDDALHSFNDALQFAADINVPELYFDARLRNAGDNAALNAVTYAAAAGHCAVKRIKFDEFCFELDGDLIQVRQIHQDDPLEEVILEECPLGRRAINVFSCRPIKHLTLLDCWCWVDDDDDGHNLFLDDFFADFYHSQPSLCELTLFNMFVKEAEMRSFCRLMQRQDCHIKRLDISYGYNRGVSGFADEAIAECASIFFGHLANMPSLRSFKFDCGCIGLPQLAKDALVSALRTTTVSFLSFEECSEGFDEDRTAEPWPEIDFWNRCNQSGRYMLKRFRENPVGTPLLGLFPKILHRSLSSDDGSGFSVLFFFLRQLAPSFAP